MLLVGDKIKQVKEIKGFNYVGEVFTIEEFDGKNIIFSKSFFGRGFMSIEEFHEFFEKVVEPTWSEWENILADTSYQYRVKDTLIEFRHKEDKKSVFAKTHENDEFDLSTGLRLCVLKMKVRNKESEIKAIKEEINIVKQYIKRKF